MIRTLLPRPAQFGHDLGEVGDHGRQGVLDAGFDRAEAGQGQTGVEVVGPDVDGDQRDLAGMILQEADREPSCEPCG